MDDIQEILTWLNWHWRVAQVLIIGGFVKWRNPVRREHSWVKINKRLLVAGKSTSICCDVGFKIQV
jgi:hypothetical protein